MSSDSDILRALADKQAITEGIYLYCRAMDRMDRALGHTLWHPGGTVDYGEVFAAETGAEFVEKVSDAHATMIATSHQVTNILIELDGDRATSEAYVTAALRTLVDGAPADRIVRGRYVDRWARRDGRWAMDHREYRHDLDHLHPLPPEAAAASPHPEPVGQ